MDRFFIIANKSKDPELEKTKAIAQFLELRGKRCGYVGIDSAFESEKKVTSVAAKIADDVDVIISLGGDGTLIQIADIASRKGIPLLGVNMGHLGYLCAVEKDKAFEAIERLINDDYEVENRMLLSGETTLASVKLAGVHALNDIVIARNGTLGTIDIKVSVNGSHLYTCYADGMIVSTPTGSTGYNLSAGGPIVAPYSEAIILTPICAHSLNVRPVVLSASDEIEVELSGEGIKPNISAEVSFDGGMAYPMKAGDKVAIKRSVTQAKLIKLSSTTFFEGLERKMSDR